MRTVIFLLLIIWFLSALGQEQQDQFINQLVETTDGVIIDDTPLPEGRLVVVRMPSHYDHEMLRLTLRPLIQADKKITVLRPWTAIDNNTHSLHLSVHSKAMTIQYSIDMNAVFVAYTLTVPERNPKPQQP